MYTLTQFMHHENQCLAESVAWHEALGHFKNDRDREAYTAGFKAGAGEARKLFQLHGGLKLPDPPMEKRIA